MELTTDVLKLIMETGQATSTIKGGGDIRPFAVLPKGAGIWGIEPLPDNLFLNPPAINKTVAVYDSDSFVEYFRAYSNPNSRVFVDLKGRLITAVLDYHEKSSDKTLPVARWGKHLLKHEFRYTRKWEAWTAKNTAVGATAPTTFGHEEFADFMEEHLQDVLDLDKKSVENMCNGIYATSTSTHNSKLSPTGPTGAKSISFLKEDGITTDGDVPLPKSIRIRLAPYEGTDVVTVTCALRGLTDAKGVKLFYRMLDIDAIMDNAVDSVFQRIQPKLAEYSFTKGTP